MAGNDSCRIQIVENTPGKQLKVNFGPHYFVDIFEKDGKATFVLGATHHGFMVDASEVNGELEKIIYEVREGHPDKAVD